MTCFFTDMKRPDDMTIDEMITELQRLSATYGNATIYNLSSFQRLRPAAIRVSFDKNNNLYDIEAEDHEDGPEVDLSASVPDWADEA
jgi:hypothetical protein